MRMVSSRAPATALPGTTGLRPHRRQALRVSRPSESLFETMATRAPRGSGCEPSMRDSSASSDTASTRITPDSASSWDEASSAGRRASTGLVIEHSRAASARSRAPPRSALSRSEYSTTTRVSSWRAQ